MKTRMPERLELTELTAISPLDGRYREIVSNLAPYVSEYGLIKSRFEIEAKYLVALSSVNVLPRKLSGEEATKLRGFAQKLTLDQARRVKEIEARTHHDVKSMERAFREMVQGTSLEDLTEFIHFGLTSEDVNNLSYRLILKRTTDNLLLPKLLELTGKLSERSENFKALPMLARTHGQPAVPTTLGKELVVFASRLDKGVKDLESVKLTGKLNGAVGNYNALKLAAPNIDWQKFSTNFVQSLELKPNLITTQINSYEDIIEHLQTLYRINSVIVDFDMDMWRYISDDWFLQIAQKDEVGSSTMPQKVNPINFENSEGNLSYANGVIEFFSRKLPISRLQRDLTDSTVMRNLGVILGHSLIGYESTLEGLAKVKPNEEKITNDLNNNWVILSEGVQTLLRGVGIKDPYSFIASLTRGEQIKGVAWQVWVDNLPVENYIKQKLHAISPQEYLGDAVKLTDIALKEIRKARKK